MSVTCPAGHASTTSDYCDTCGAPIEAPPDPTVTLPATAGEPAPAEAAAAPAACPSCGEPVTGRFCEGCGYDIVTGKAAAPATVVLDVGADRAHWQRMVGSGEPAFPAVPPTLSFELSGERATLGRVRAGAPVDVDLPLAGPTADPGVSHHQCVFERAGATWAVRDTGSANGTWINDAARPLAEGATHPLAPGDRIFMGAWTCLTVRVVPAGGGSVP